MKYRVRPVYCCHVYVSDMRDIDAGVRPRAPLQPFFSSHSFWHARTCFLFRTTEIALSQTHAYVVHYHRFYIYT